jgi:hypothetical protein
MNPTERLLILRAHEWAYKEDLRHVYCQTCGKQHTAAKAESSASMPHRKGCGYFALIVEAIR